MLELGPSGARCTGLPRVLHLIALTASGLVPFTTEQGHILEPVASYQTPESQDGDFKQCLHGPFLSRSNENYAEFIAREEKSWHGIPRILHWKKQLLLKRYWNCDEHN